MKKYRVNTDIPTVAIKVELILKPDTSEFGFHSVKKVTVKRPYYRIFDYLGNELFETSQFNELLNKMDEYEENGDYDYIPYIQDETYIDRVLIGFKNQRLLKGWY